MQSKNIFQQDLMPDECSGGIDLIHVDKGKTITMGKFPDKKGKLKDQACLLAKNADYPYDSFEVKVKDGINNVDFFAVTHHGLPIRVHPWVAMPSILYSLPAQEGMRFDVGFKNDASCDFVKSDIPYAIQTPMRKESLEKTGDVVENMDSTGRHVVIECKGSGKVDPFKTADYVDRAEQVMGKKVTPVTRHGSVLKEFVDAARYRKDNNTRFIFNSPGEITFTPNYFTEQWFMTRGGGQMKKKAVFGDRRSDWGLGAKFKRLEREIEFLFDGGEWKTLVDVSGKNIEVGQPGESSDKIIKGSDKVEIDPNTHVIHKAFIDPDVMDEISLNSPRYGKVKTAVVKIKSGSTCEIRTNFKRRPAPMIENLLFCTRLDDGMSFDEKASSFLDGFEDRLEELKKAAKKK